MTTSDRSAAPLAATDHPDLARYLTAYRDDPRLHGTYPQQSVLDAARAMTIRTEPFTYGVIDDFLPPALFAAVLTAWPPDESLEAVALPSAGRYVGSRRTALLEGPDGLQTAALSGHPWDELRATLRAPDLLEALAQRFPDVLDDNLARHDTTSAWGPAFKLWLNQDEGVGDALGAHVDDLRKIMTIVVYLGLTGDVDQVSSHRWGTALYDSDDGAVTPMTFSSNADHTPASMVEFAPNRAFVMPNTATALHGVAGGQAGVTRTTLMCGYWRTVQ